MNNMGLGKSSGARKCVRGATGTRWTIMAPTSAAVWPLKRTETAPGATRRLRVSPTASRR